MTLIVRRLEKPQEPKVFAQLLAVILGKGTPGERKHFGTKRGTVKPSWVFALVSTASSRPCLILCCASPIPLCLETSRCAVSPPVTALCAAALLVSPSTKPRPPPTHAWPVPALPLSPLPSASPLGYTVGLLARWPASTPLCRRVDRSGSCARAERA